MYYYAGVAKICPPLSAKTRFYGLAQSLETVRGKQVPDHASVSVAQNAEQVYARAQTFSVSP